MSNNHINFTKKIIDSLPIPARGKRLYFYDTKIQGLELMVTDQGTKSFKVYRKLDRKPVRITLGKYPEMTVEHARKEAQKVIAELMSGKNPNEEKKKIKNETTFGEMYKLFMERYSKPSKKTWMADERAGIKDLRLHDLRRTPWKLSSNYWSYSYIIGRSLGHKSSQSTAIYARLNIRLRDSVEKATQLILGHMKRD